jgi:hypothetical protein
MFRPARLKFFRPVKRDLRLRRVAFDRRALEAFCASMAPLVTDDDNPVWRADTFLESQGPEPGVRELGRPAAGAFTKRNGANFSGSARFPAVRRWNSSWACSSVRAGRCCGRLEVV